MRIIIAYILLFINTICVLSLIFSLISPFINPNVFWPISFLGLFFPIIIISVIILAIIWYFYNKKFMWINIFFVIISLPFMVRYIAINPTSINLEQESIKIMSYNVRLFNVYKWINKDNIDKQIIDFIHGQELDILCIQEYYNPYHNINLDFKYAHIGLQKNKFEWHMAIYSNYPHINKKTVKIGNKEMNNTCIYSDIKINQDTIRIYNIHLASNSFSQEDLEFIHSPHFEKGTMQEGIIGISKRLKRSFESRGDELDYIKDHIKNSPYPTIICGDFNDTPVSYAYQELSYGKKDAFIESGNGIGSTYFKIPVLRIDYILYDKILKSRNFITHQKELSDHRAISTEIILPIQDLQQ